MRWHLDSGSPVSCTNQYAGEAWITACGMAGSSLWHPAPQKAQPSRHEARCEPSGAQRQDRKHPMKKYLVTGGCGFIGVNLLTQLSSRGDRVRVLDNLSLGKREDIERFKAELHVGDIRDAAAVAKACEGMDVVVHLAAHTRVIESVENPRLNFEIN